MFADTQLFCTLVHRLAFIAKIFIFLPMRTHNGPWASGRRLLVNTTVYRIFIALNHVLFYILLYGNIITSVTFSCSQDLFCTYTHNVLP